MKRLLVALIASGFCMSVAGQNVSVNAKNVDAERVFESIMKQTGKNFVYPSGLLKNVKVSVFAKDEPLYRVIEKMFSNTSISYKIKGNNVILSRMPKENKITISGYVCESETGEALIGAIVRDKKSGRLSVTNAAGFYSIRIEPGQAEISASFPTFETVIVNKDIKKSEKLDFFMKESTNEDGQTLNEVTIIADRNKSLAMESTDIGRLNLSRNDIQSTPTLFGESDVVKTLQLQPGVSAGTEGLAGMYVHGGGNDENLYMLDNVPLYQVNHFGGLFSAFNTEAIKNVDFYKSTFPAKYDGRLSSIMEVHTKDGDKYSHHGSFKLGLTSGAFQIDGPIQKERTTYSLAFRRSWYDVLTIPTVAIYNAVRQDKENKLIAGYAFMDINAKITHRFNTRSSVHAMFYFGEDYLKGGSEENYVEIDDGDTFNRDVSTLRWGNLVGALGWNYEFSNKLFGEFTLSYTHYKSSLRREDVSRITVTSGENIRDDFRDYKSSNGITDWSVRADFGWNPFDVCKIDFGMNATHHSFLPQNIKSELRKKGEIVNAASVNSRVNAMSSSLYINGSCDIADAFRLNAGVNLGMFRVPGTTHVAFDPRLSFLWQITKSTNIKAGWSRMTQNVHQLTESAISLPTDQWVPVSAGFKPQRSDKISLSANYCMENGLIFSLEGYWKWMRHIIDYRDDYYLYPTGTLWTSLLCSGNGIAKGVDFKVSKSFGKISGYISYSLLWADRQFDEKNNGRRFPARYDNRHKINIAANWEVNQKWSINAAWTGMSGNMTTLQTQCYDILDTPGIPFYTSGIITSVGQSHYYGSIDMGSGINNYRLPFYHRLDISATRKTKHGMWTFSLYNAYCNMNVISIKKNDNIWKDDKPFQKFRLIPVIPSVSYTWFF